MVRSCSKDWLVNIIGNSRGLEIVPASLPIMLSLWVQFVLHLEREFYLGSTTLQVLRVACCEKLVLDCWSTCQEWVPHPAASLLCNQAEESIQHILVSCVFCGSCGAQFFKLWVWSPCRHSPTLKGRCPNAGVHRSSWCPWKLGMAWEIWKHQSARLWWCKDECNTGVVVLQTIANEWNLVVFSWS